MTDFKKILFVDDSAIELEEVSSALEQTGYVVIRADCGALALDILGCNSDIKLVITNMVLPDLEGKELIKRARTFEAYRDIPCIIVSERMSLHQIDELLELGAAYFMPKPLKIEDLFEYITKLLKK